MKDPMFSAERSFLHLTRASAPPTETTLTLWAVIMPLLVTALLLIGGAA